MNILLHICCSNCSLYPVKTLREEGITFTGFWFNPNIHPLEEYGSRLDSVKTLSDRWNIDMIYHEAYTPEDYFRMFGINDKNLINNIRSNGSGSSNGWNDLNIPPFPERCRSCYMLRLEKTAELAKEQGFDAFSTTLLISPYQDFEGIADTGHQLAEKYDIHFHLRDYRPYFRDAMALSKELGLYRQKYCGCIFSKKEREKQKAAGKRSGAMGKDKKPMAHRP